MNIMRMALRNLGRTKSRTMLSFISIAVGVMMVILTKGFVDGALNQLLGSTVRFAAGHIRVIDEEYSRGEQLLSLNYTLDDSVVADIQQIQGFAAVSPRIRFGGLISRNDDTEGVMVTAINQELEEPLSEMSRFLNGRWMRDGQREAVLGAALLNRLGLDVGDRFTLVFNTAFGSMRGYTFDVVGKLESGYAYLDDNNIFLDLSLAQQMLEMEGEVTEILLYAQNENQLNSLMGEVEQVVPDSASVVHWHSHSELVEYYMIARHLYLIFYLIILALASFVVINTMVMIVNERVREIGMLGALGLNQGQILRLFLYEGGLIGLGGSIVGAILGGILVYVLSVVGFELLDPSVMDADFFLTPRLYTEFSLNLVLFSIGLGTLVTSLAVYFPSRQAARLDPTKALRGNI